MQINKTKGIEKLKNTPYVKQRSIPLQKRNTQTELYFLRKEKERFQKERERLLKRQEFIDQRLAQINQELKGLLVLWQDEMKVIAEEAGVDSIVKDKKEWKTKPLNY